MYLTDPDMGRRRRALLRDQYTHAKRVVREGTENAVRDATNRVGGLIGKAQERLDERQAQRDSRLPD
jgi:ribosomal protein S17E